MIFKLSLPSAEKALGKEFFLPSAFFTEDFLLGTRQRDYLPSARKKTLVKSFSTWQRAEFR
jgi:hypothetical protein